MKNLDSGLVCLEISSIAIGYRALHALTNESESRVLEASPVGAGFLILARGASADLEKRVQAVRQSIDGTESDLWIDRELIAQANAAVVESVFGLPQTELGESLIVVECKTVSGCLASAHALVASHALKPIEIRIRRSVGGAYGFFTGPAATCAAAAEEARTKLRLAMREGHIEVIDSPSPMFRSFFNLSGN